MYAIAEIQGQQFRIAKDKFLYVHRLPNEEGSEITLNKVLLLADDNGKITVGKPTVGNVTIKAKVISHLRDDKVAIFKKKRRKGYQKRSGHRQDLSKILIEEFSL